MGTQSNGNAIFDDIIKGDRYKGAIESISWLTGIVDNFFIAIISFCGFFIVSIVFLRSALICLYASYPRLFNNVHEIKTNLQGNRGGGPGGMLMWILSIFIPDVKAMTDIDDNENGYIDIKSMLFKTCITGAILIMIGTMIYNGYYRDLMGMLSNAGAHVFETYIYSIDLSSAIDNALEAGSDYEFNYGAAGGGPAKNSLANEVYKTVKNHYGRTLLNSTDDRWIVGQDIEKWLNDKVFTDSLKLAGLDTINDGFENDSVVDIKYSVALVPQAVSDSTSEQAGSFYKTYCANIHNEVCSSFQPDGLSNAKDEYLRLSILITPKTSKGAATIGVDRLNGWKLTIGYEKSDNDHIYYVAIPNDASLTQFTLSGKSCSQFGSTADGVATFKLKEPLGESGLVTDDLWSGMNSGGKSSYTVKGPLGSAEAKKAALTELGTDLKISTTNPVTKQDVTNAINKMLKEAGGGSSDTGDKETKEPTTEGTTNSNTKAGGSSLANPGD